VHRRELSRLLLAAAAGGPASASAAEAPPCGDGCFPATREELDARIPLPELRYPPGDVRRYGAVANTAGATSHNSSVLQRVFSMVRKTGGRIEFPAGDWYLQLDISGAATRSVIIEGNGSTFRPPPGDLPKSTIIYANNTALVPDHFAHSRVEFRNCHFVGRSAQSTSAGDAHYTVYFEGAAAVFYDCSFQYAKSAGFYAAYGQYNEFWSCLFGACTDSPESAGCVLDSNGAVAASNEVFFSRCKFYTCSNFLWVKGAFLTRIRDSTFQGAPSGGRAGIILDADRTGQGTVGTIIDGCWFEINRVPHILGRVCRDVRLHMNDFFTSGGLNEIRFDLCHDIQGSDNSSYGPMSMIVAHPARSAAPPSISWRGGNIVPMITVSAGRSPLVDVTCADVALRRRDNVLLTTGQTGTYGLPLLQSDEYGFKTGVPRRVATDIFAMNLAAFAAASHAPVLVLDVQLFVWQDAPASPRAFAQCGRCQRFHAFITNNRDQLAAYVATIAEGSDLGSGAGGGGIGALTLEVSVSGSSAAGNAVATFSASYPGGGVNAAAVSSVTIGYRVTAMGGNGFSLTRL
jgi:hypothetical protein